MSSRCTPNYVAKANSAASPTNLGDHIKHYISKYNVGRTLKARDYVLPMPLKEMQGNPNVTQNKEWQ